MKLSPKAFQPRQYHQDLCRPRPPAKHPSSLSRSLPRWDVSDIADLPADELRAVLVGPRGQGLSRCWKRKRRGGLSKNRRAADEKYRRPFTLPGCTR